jgi:hypothetical protein
MGLAGNARTAQPASEVKVGGELPPARCSLRTWIPGLDAPERGGTSVSADACIHAVSEETRRSHPFLREWFGAARLSQSELEQATDEIAATDWCSALPAARLILFAAIHR